MLLEQDWNVIRLSFDHPETGNARLFKPRKSISLTAAGLTQLRDAVRPIPMLNIDYHHRLSMTKAASFCQQIPRGTLDFLEEPIRDKSPKTYHALRSMIDIPFAIGEKFSSK